MNRNGIRQRFLFQNLLTVFDECEDQIKNVATAEVLHRHNHINMNSNETSSLVVDQQVTFLKSV